MAWLHVTNTSVPYTQLPLVSLFCFFYQYSPMPCLLYSLTTPILRIYAKVASSPNLKERMPASYKQMRKAQKNDYRQEKQINLWLCQLLWCRQINTIQSKIIISFKSTDSVCFGENLSANRRSTVGQQTVESRPTGFLGSSSSQLPLFQSINQRLNVPNQCWSIMWVILRCLHQF